MSVATIKNLKLPPSPADGLLNRNLNQLGFREVDMEPAYRVIASTTAGEKSGKTHWAFTAPGPIGVVSTDTGTEEIARKFVAAGKRVVICPFRNAKELIEESKKQAEYEREWDSMKGAIRAINQDPKFRTLVIDTGTEAWELCRLACFGKLTQVKPHHYAQVNGEFDALVRLTYARKDLNAIWIHKTKKEYKTGAEGKDSWTGRMERSGYSNMPFAVEVNLKQYFARNRKNEVGEELAPAFCIEVVDCRAEMLDVQGSIFEGDMCSFPFLAEALFPDTIGSGLWE